MNSQQKNTYSIGDFVLKYHYKKCVLKISGIQTYIGVKNIYFVPITFNNLIIAWFSNKKYTVPIQTQKLKTKFGVQINYL